MPFVEMRAALSGDVLIKALPLQTENIEMFKLQVTMTVASMVGALEHWITLTWKSMHDGNWTCLYYITMLEVPQSCW